MCYVVYWLRIVQNEVAVVAITESQGTYLRMRTAAASLVNCLSIQALYSQPFRNSLCHSLFVVNMRMLVQFFSATFISPLIYQL